MPTVPELDPERSYLLSYPIYFDLAVAEAWVRAPREHSNFVALLLSYPTNHLFLLESSQHRYFVKRESIAKSVAFHATGQPLTSSNNLPNDRVSEAAWDKATEALQDHALHIVRCTCTAAEARGWLLMN